MAKRKKSSEPPIELTEKQCGKLTTLSVAYFRRGYA